MNIVVRSSLIWLGFFALAFLNGALREVLIKRFIAEPWAHHISVFTAILFFGAYAFLQRDRLALSSTSDTIIVGALWVVLTIFAETFIVGRWLGKHSWDEIAKNYDMLRGNLWPLVLLWLALLPRLLYHLKR